MPESLPQDGDLSGSEVVASHDDIQIVELEKLDEELVRSITPSTVPGGKKQQGKSSANAQSPKRSTYLPKAAPDDPGPDGNAYTEKK